MEIPISEVTDGSRNGEVVYVCDYRLNDEIHRKPIRVVPPTKVVVVSNDDVDKNVYYSSSAFKVIGKNGNTTSKIIVPYDNTGYRSYPGVPLKVFTDEQECIEHWNSDVDVAIKAISEYRDSMVQSLNDRIAKLVSTKK